MFAVQVITLLLLSHLSSGAENVVVSRFHLAWNTSAGEWDVDGGTINSNIMESLTDRNGNGLFSGTDYRHFQKGLFTYPALLESDQRPTLSALLEDVERIVKKEARTRQRENMDDFIQRYPCKLPSLVQSTLHVDEKNANVTFIVIGDNTALKTFKKPKLDTEDETVKESVNVQYNYQNFSMGPVNELINDELTIELQGGHNCDWGMLMLYDMFMDPIPGENVFRAGIAVRLFIPTPDESTYENFTWAVPLVYVSGTSGFSDASFSLLMNSLIMPFTSYVDNITKPFPAHAEDSLEDIDRRLAYSYLQRGNWSLGLQTLETRAVVADEFRKKK